jgi:hypothetical protein
MSRGRRIRRETEPTTTSNLSGLWTLNEIGDYISESKWPRGPAAPTSLSATVGATQLSLSWDAPATTHGTITNYLVEYTPSGGSASYVLTNSNSTSYTLTGLINGTSYSVRVAAVNFIAGDYSNTATETPSEIGLITHNDLLQYGTSTGIGISSDPFIFTGSIQALVNVFTVVNSGTLYINVTNQNNTCGDSDQGSIWYKNNVFTLAEYCKSSYSRSFSVQAGDVIAVTYEAPYGGSLKNFNAYVA